MKDPSYEITSTFAIVRVGEPTAKNHGREAWTISIGHGECAIDLSFTPTPGGGRE